MADDTIYRMGRNVRVIGRPPHDVVVQIWGGGDWRDMRKFHRISDDYAFTNAREYAEQLAKDNV